MGGSEVRWKFRLKLKFNSSYSRWFSSWIKSLTSYCLSHGGEVPFHLNLRFQTSQLRRQNSQIHIRSFQYSEAAIRLYFSSLLRFLSPKALWKIESAQKDRRARTKIDPDCRLPCSIYFNCSIKYGIIRGQLKTGHVCFANKRKFILIISRD